MGYSPIEYSKMYREIRQAFGPIEVSDTIIAAIIKDMGHDRRMAAIQSERMGRASEPNTAPKSWTIESVKTRLGEVAKLVVVDQAGDEIRITLLAGLDSAEFDMAKTAVKALGARYVSSSRMWIL